MEKFTHFDPEGRSRVVDVGAKTPTHRIAVATGAVRMNPETLQAILEQRMHKGDVLAVAQLAGIQGAKHTPSLIPLCHPLSLTSVEVQLQADPALPGVRIRARVEAIDRTGVEMEALTSVTAAALTIYDMCKAVDRGMVLSEFQLKYKTGGKSGTYCRDEEASACGQGASDKES